MSQTSGNFRSTDASLRSKVEADARPLDKRAVDAFGRETRTIDADKRANKQSGNGARLVRTQRAVA